MSCASSPNPVRSVRGSARTGHRDAIHVEVHRTDDVGRCPAQLFRALPPDGVGRALAFFTFPAEASQASRRHLGRGRPLLHEELGRVWPVAHKDDTAVGWPIHRPCDHGKEDAHPRPAPAGAMLRTCEPPPIRNGEAEDIPWQTMGGALERAPRSGPPSGAPVRIASTQVRHADALRRDGLQCPRRVATAIGAGG